MRSGELKFNANYAEKDETDIMCVFLSLKNLGLEKKKRKSPFARSESFEKASSLRFKKLITRLMYELSLMRFGSMYESVCERR